MFKLIARAIQSFISTVLLFLMIVKFYQFTAGKIDFQHAMVYFMVCGVFVICDEIESLKD